MIYSPYSLSYPVFLFKSFAKLFRSYLYIQKSAFGQPPLLAASTRKRGATCSPFACALVKMCVGSSEESGIYDLDSSDIAEIRLETYKECGWNYDAGKDEDEDEEDEEIEYEPTYRSLTAIYCDLGLNIRDHFCCR